MRKSPGFDEGHWLKMPNSCPRFCAACIGESFRSCWMQRKPKNHTVLSLQKFFSRRTKIVCFRLLLRADILKVI